MAITQDASTPAAVSAISTVSTTLVTASFTPPAGSLLVAQAGFAFASLTGTGPSLSISDSASGTWTAGPSAYDTRFGGAYIWTRPCSSSPGSITVTLTGPSASHTWFLNVTVLDGTAVSQSGAASNSTFSSSTSATPWTGSITTTVTGSWVLLACEGDINANTITPNSSTTTLNSLQDNTLGGWSIAGKQTNATTTPGSVTLGWTPSAADSYAWAALEILPAGLFQSQGSAIPPRRKPRRAVVTFKPVTTTNGAAVVPPSGTVQPQTAQPAPRKKPRRAAVRFKPLTTTNAAPPTPVRVVNQWAGTFTQPFSFGANFAPTLASVVVPLTPASSVGGGTGTPTAGNWLFCMVAMNEYAAATGSTVAVNDDIHSFWRPGNVNTSTWSVSTSAARTRTAIWYTPNIAAAAGNVYVAPDGSFDALAVLVIEVSGLGPWDTVTGINANYAATSTSLPLSLAAPPGAAFILGAAGGDSTLTGQTFAPGGWSTLSTVSVTDGSDHLEDAVLTSAWVTTSGGVSVSATATSATNLSGVLLGVLTSAPSPVPANQNPNWPYLKVEAAFNGGFQTPPDQLQWTDLTARTWGWDESTGIQYQLGQVRATDANLEFDNYDGALTPIALPSAWSFTASGTPAANNYFIVTTAQAASIAVGNGFTDTSNPGTFFVVSGVGAPFAGFVNVTFTPAAGTIMSNPDVVSQATLETGTPVRVRAALGTVGGVVFNRWYVIMRNVQEWIQQINANYRRYLQVSATDIWSALSASCFTPYRGEVFQDKPYAWWPCDDQLLTAGVLPASLRNAAPGNSNVLNIVKPPGGAAVQYYYDTNGVSVGTYVNAINSAAVYTVGANAGWMYGDPQSSQAAYGTSSPVTSNPGSAAFQASGQAGNSGSNGWFLSCNDASFPALSGGITVEGWFNYAFFGSSNLASANAINYYAVCQQPETSLTLIELATASNPVAVLQLDTSGHLNLITYNGGAGTSHSIYSASDLRTQSWFHVAMTLTTTAWTVYVNGGATAEVSGTATGMTSAWTWLIANGDLGANGGSSAGTGLVHGGNVNVSHLAVYPYIIPDYRIMSHYWAAITGFGVLPAPQSVSIQWIDTGNNTSASTNTVSANACAPDGTGAATTSSYHTTTGVNVSVVVTANTPNSITSGPSAWVSAAHTEDNLSFGGISNRATLWISWTGVAPSCNVYTATTTGGETEAAVVCGSGDAFTQGYGSSAVGTGVGQTSGGSGASPPASGTSIGDTPGQRIERILSYGQATYPGRCIDPATLLIQAATDVGGQASATNISSIAKSDGGMLFVDTQGNLTYWSKTHLAAQQSSPAWTLGPAANGATVIPYARTMQWIADPQRVWTFIQITPFSPSGAQLATIEPANATGVDTALEQFGAQPLQITSYLQSTAEMQTQANWLFTNYGTLQIRVDNISVDAASYPAAWGMVLGASVGDVISVQNWQVGGGAATGTFRISGLRRRLRFGGQSGQVEGVIEIQADFEPSSYWS